MRESDERVAYHHTVGKRRHSRHWDNYTVCIIEQDAKSEGQPRAKAGTVIMRGYLDETPISPTGGVSRQTPLHERGKGGRRVET